MALQIVTHRSGGDRTAHDPLEKAGIRLQYAFSVNMKLGVLVTGGDQPRRIESNFERLIETGVLLKE